MSTPKEQSLDELVSRGFQQVREGDLEDALKTAKEVEELRNTAAFEIAALAHTGMDNPEAAIKVLQRGVKLGPDAWVNWQLLGNLFSDQGRFEEAEDAFRDALLCPDVWEASLHLNQAILAARQGKFEDALAKLTAITDEDLYFEVASALVNTFGRLGRKAEALELATEVLQEKPLSDSDEDAWYYIAVLELRMRWEEGLAPETVRERVLLLTRKNSDNEAALTLLRDTRGEYSPGCQYFRLVIRGNFTEAPDGADGFYVPYDIVAESPEEAMRFVEEVEGSRGFDHLEIEDCEVILKRTKDPKGVYRFGGRAYYSE